MRMPLEYSLSAGELPKDLGTFVPQIKIMPFTPANLNVVRKNSLKTVYSTCCTLKSQVL